MNPNIKDTLHEGIKVFLITMQMYQKGISRSNPIIYTTRARYTMQAAGHSILKQI